MDPQKVDTSGAPIFYKNIFKVWNLYGAVIGKNARSLFWLLQEPLIHGTRFDGVGNTGRLIKAGCTTLEHLVNTAGPDFENIEETAAMLGFKSIRLVRQMLMKWRSTLEEEEIKILSEFYQGFIKPNEEDPFYNLILSPKMDECEGPFLEKKDVCFDADSFNVKEVYKSCVKVFNRKVLNNRSDTPWRSVLGLSMDCRPEWRALYKPPLPKRGGDMQWRILHGVIAVNAFISLVNPEISSDCPFCMQRETVFHAFMYCCRLRPLFNVLERFFKSFNEDCSMQMFICGFKYVRRRASECQLFNFVLGQSKMAIYVSRRNKVENISGQDVLMVFANLIKSRVIIDFNFFKAMNDLSSFETKWCSRNVLCSVCEGMLFFASFLQ